MTPELVARAVELGLIEPGEADRFLRGDDRPTPVLHIKPRTPPPPERLVLVRRPDGRVRRVRAAMTKALLRAGVLDRNLISDHPSTTRSAPQEDSA